MSDAESADGLRDRLVDAERRADEAERTLVAYDALMEGRAADAALVAPGAFEIRRRHAAERLPRSVLEALLDCGHDGRHWPWAGDDAPRPWMTDNHWLSTFWRLARPQRYYVSAEARLTGGEQEFLSEASRGRTDRSTYEGRSHMGWHHVNVPRALEIGPPRDWTWLITSWRLRWGVVAPEWDVTAAEGWVGIRVGNDPREHVRAFADASADDDLLLVAPSATPIILAMDVRREPRWLVPRCEPTDGEARPRVYVDLNVIELRPR